MGILRSVLRTTTELVASQPKGITVGVEDGDRVAIRSMEQDVVSARAAELLTKYPRDYSLVQARYPWWETIQFRGRHPSRSGTYRRDGC